MGADKQALDAIFLDVVEPQIIEGVNYANKLRDILKTKKSDFKGRQILKAAHTGGNISPMFSTEGAILSDAGNQTHINMYVDQKKLTSRLAMTKEVMIDSTSSEGAFTSARASEQKYVIKDIARRDEYALNTDGRGILALVDESPSGTTLDVDAPGGITNDNFGNRFLQKGMFIAAVNPTTGAIRSTIHRVESTPAAGSTIVVDSATHTGWADNDYIVQAANLTISSVVNTSFENAWWGLMALVDDGTYRANYFGVPRADVPFTSSYVNATTGAVSADLFHRVSDIVSQKSEGVIDLIVCHHSTRREIVKLTDADRRYTGADLQRPDRGTAAFQQGDIPFGTVNIRALKDFPLDVIMLLDTKNTEFTEYVSSPGEWEDTDGVWQRQGTGTGAVHSFEALFWMRKQYFADNPMCSARLDGVTGQTLVVQRPAGW